MNQSEKEKNEKIAAMQKLIDIIAETLGSLSYVASKLAKEKCIIVKLFINLPMK